MDFDGTNNLFIEAENLEALKILQKAYAGSVKMIYIDPPYNTGSDSFIYPDKFSETREEYARRVGDKDDEGYLKRDGVFQGAWRKNSKESGHYHSNWLSMMLPRLHLAKTLLRDDGVIFISIDDNEQAQLKLLCDEVFGAENFVACIIVDGTPKNDPYIVSTAHEYCLVYTKNFEIAKTQNYGIKNPIYGELIQIFETHFSKGNLVVEEELNKYYKKNKLINDNIANYKFCDEFGIYRIGPIDDPQSSGTTDIRINPKTGKPCKIPSRGWSCNIDTWKEWEANHLIYFPDDDNSLPAKKTYIHADRLDILRAYFKMQTRKDSDALKRMFETKTTVFSNPKPIQLIKSFLSICQNRDFLVMDFFVGSGTLPHAVYELNQKNPNSNIRYIAIQLPEELDVSRASSNKAKKIIKSAIDFLTKHNKPTNIAEIAKERIRRAGRQIREQHPEKTVDTGFKVFKLAESHFKQWRPSENGSDGLEAQLAMFIAPVAEHAEPLNMAYELMLRLGLKLTCPLHGSDGVYWVEDEDTGKRTALLLTCADEHLIDAVIAENPAKVVALDRLFDGNDSLKSNTVLQMRDAGIIFECV
ncbi:site-specific DNA-methyltransferase [Neisseria weaveri]|uniref:site-specific DNA-methyltransferase n=1 Tax=Neisseria weaveri TaxID=28091 RepID=UPI000D30506D|nr:site-specific DNA-methyltransferase [Neisseria weaveri]